MSDAETKLDKLRNDMYYEAFWIRNDCDFIKESIQKQKSRLNEMRKSLDDIDVFMSSILYRASEIEGKAKDE